ncbi:MAG TPA: HEAT repeat domain-containing protein [Candidatus Sulfotelmatobacter sp.]|nr:HEAT repeat domain-containing protein [Candidatus Sulfotelmatobacter sp.]
MDQFSTGTQGASAPEFDPRLQPTPDYGTLGPGSDISNPGTGSQGLPKPRQSARVASVIAALVGALGAFLTANIGKSRQPAQKFFSPGRDRSVESQNPRQIDAMAPQRQAEALLERAVAQDAGAVEQISSRVGDWQGKLQWNSQIANLTTAALNSSNLQVRESGVEVELAAYRLAKNSSSLEYLLRTAESPNHAQKIWALWALGLMGNRGVQQDRVLQVLTSHLNDSDADSRRWTAEALGLVGADQSIEPLLKAMHDDRSPLVRERAACALAESGLFTPEQRMSAVPQLLNYTDDPSLDAQTHAWAFHALSDITHQHLPNDAAAWRNWYEARPSQ